MELIGCLYSGGLYDDIEYDDILEFHPDSEDWSLAGHMIKARYWHAVSTIQFEEIKDHCIM